MSSYTEMAQVYDRLMEDVDYAAWADYYHALAARFGIGPGASLAEAACGTGNMTMELARRGYRVTASDRSARMLRVAQDKLRESGLGVTLVRQDMRALELHRPADGVLCACDGVNYLTSPADVLAFFRSAYGLLRPGGALLFDISSRHKLERKLAGRFYGEDLEDITYLWHNRYDPTTRLMEMELTFFALQSPGGVYRRFDESHVQRAHDCEEILSWLNQAGFTQCASFGELTFDPPRQNARRIHFAAVKPHLQEQGRRD